MTFLELYGEGLSRELGSSDTLLLFTTSRRKAAINQAQQWFVTQTECLTVTAEIPIVSGTGEYDLEDEIANDAFLMLATKRAPVLKMDPGGGGDIVYATGRDFIRRAIPWLDQYVPGWRSAEDGTPEAWYEKAEGGTRLFGLYPPPDVPSGATWTLQIPYVVLPADLSADADEPFTVSSDPRRSLLPWYDALPYYAASELEKLRKGTERSLLLRQQAEARVLDYLDKQRVPGGKSIRVTRTYRSESRRSGAWQEDDPWK